jgi:hypothetical protein
VVGVEIVGEFVLLGFAIEAAGSTSTRKRLSLSAQLARGWPCASCDEHCSNRFPRQENSKKKTNEGVNLGFIFGQSERCYGRNAVVLAGR